MPLTTEQIAFYEENGYVVVSGFFNENIVNEMQSITHTIADEAKQLSVSEQADLRGTRVVLATNSKSEKVIKRAVWAAAANPKLLIFGRDQLILTAVSQLLRSETADHLINQIHYKLPGDEVAFPWHQDEQNRRAFDPAWQDINGIGSFVQTLAAIDQCTEDNGPLNVIPKSHLWGYLEFEDFLQTDELQRRLTNRNIDVSTAQIPLLLNPGDMVFMHPRLVHGSWPNTSNTPRRMFINGFSYPGANHKPYPGEGSAKTISLITGEELTVELTTAGVTDTGLVTNYWKERAREIIFWHPDYHGKATREKPLFKDDLRLMRLFINIASTNYAETMLPPILALALAVRHKYINKMVSNGVKAKENPTRQIIILGSGYDTRSVRKQKYTLQFGVRFFEIDHRAVLDNKQAIFAANHIDPNAIYIGIDYLTEDFIEHLKNNGVDTTLPTHFIWEGNTMYVPKEKIYSILEKIKNSFSGNLLISFDYLAQSVVDKMLAVRETTAMIDTYKQAKAPMITGYNDIRAELANELGLTVLDNENPACSDVTKEYGVGDHPYASQENYHFCTLRNR